MVVKFRKKLWESHKPEPCKAKLGQKAQWHVSSLSFFISKFQDTPVSVIRKRGKNLPDRGFSTGSMKKYGMVWYVLLTFYWHIFYKKPIYKKPRATEAENLRNWRATFLAPKKLFYWETENRQFFTKIGPKITKKSEN